MDGRPTISYSLCSIGLIRDSIVGTASGRRPSSAPRARSWGIFGLRELPHDSRRAIHFDEIAIVPQFGGMFDSGNARQSVFSGNQGTVLEEPSDLKNHARGMHEEWRPSGIGGFARTRSPSCAIAIPRSASADASSRKATRFSASWASPAASARAAAVISESI